MPSHLPHDLREGHSRLLAAGERTHLLERCVAAQAHPPQMRTDLERLRIREGLLEGLERRQGEVELVDVVLGEPAEAMNEVISMQMREAISM